MEQIADTEQIAALGYLLKYAGTHFYRRQAESDSDRGPAGKEGCSGGLAALADDGYLPVNFMHAETPGDICLHRSLPQHDLLRNRRILN